MGTGRGGTAGRCALWLLAAFAWAGPGHSWAGECRPWPDGQHACSGGSAGSAADWQSNESCGRHACTTSCHERQQTGGASETLPLPDERIFGSAVGGGGLCGKDPKSAAIRPRFVAMPVAWGPGHPWLYRPRWVYPYRYYPLRWSYSVYSPYYFYSPYRFYRPFGWPPVWAAGGWWDYGRYDPWYGWRPCWGAVQPHVAVRPACCAACGAGGGGGCLSCACSDWPGVGACGPLPYDTGPYAGWPYDAGRSFAAPGCWAASGCVSGWACGSAQGCAGCGGCCAAGAARPCPPGRRDASGALHW
jgi:hypothetical protein